MHLAARKHATLSL